MSKPEKAAYDKGYYQANKARIDARSKRYYEEHKEERKAYFKALWGKRRAYIESIIAGGRCMRCGNDDPRILIFHHRDPAEKQFTIRSSNRTHRVVDREVAKCDILCRNCHAIVHMEMAVCQN